MARDDPWDEWARRRPKRGEDDPFAAFFGPEFEQEFERMRAYMARVMQDLMKDFPQGGFPGAGAMPRGAKPGEPFVYGFSVRMGPDGKPQFQQFGNTEQARNVPDVGREGAREPLTDVLVDEKQVAVTAELPGVEKSDINLHVADDSVTIRVNAGRKYFKKVALPAEVVPKSATATFKNGILDLTLERKERDDDPGHRVDIR